MSALPSLTHLLLLKMFLDMRKNRKGSSTWLNGYVCHEDDDHNPNNNDSDDEDFQRPPEECDDWMFLRQLNQNHQEVGD